PARTSCRLSRLPPTYLCADPARRTTPRSFLLRDMRLLHPRWNGRAHPPSSFVRSAGRCNPCPSLTCVRAPTHDIYSIAREPAPVCVRVLCAGIWVPQRGLTYDGRTRIPKQYRLREQDRVIARPSLPASSPLPATRADAADVIAPRLSAPHLPTRLESLPPIRVRVLCAGGSGSRSAAWRRTSFAFQTKTVLEHDHHPPPPRPRSPLRVLMPPTSSLFHRPRSALLPQARI
ncbi:hypothetical protein B0H13DRAFT_2071309, partial [Mycena leptocephala]